MYCNYYRSGLDVSRSPLLYLLSPPDLAHTITFNISLVRVDRPRRQSEGPTVVQFTCGFVDGNDRSRLNFERQTAVFTQSG